MPMPFPNSRRVMAKPRGRQRPGQFAGIAGVGLLSPALIPAGMGYGLYEWGKELPERIKEVGDYARSGKDLAGVAPQITSLGLDAVLAGPGRGTIKGVFRGRFSKDKLVEDLPKDKAIWFTDAKDYPGRLSLKNVGEFNLDLKRPLDMRNLGEMATGNQIQKFYNKHGLSELRPKHGKEGDLTPIFDEAKGRTREVLLKHGYDGIMLKEAGGTSYVAFHPEQAKYVGVAMPRPQRGAGTKIAKDLGIIYNGPQLGPKGEVAVHLFTDTKTGSTFSAKTLAKPNVEAGLKEMQEKFVKGSVTQKSLGIEPTKPQSFGITSPITRKKLTRFKIDKSPTYWEEKYSTIVQPGQRIRNIAHPGGFGVREQQKTHRGYRLFGYSPETKTWEWVDTLKNPIEAERALIKWNKALVKGVFEKP